MNSMQTPVKIISHMQKNLDKTHSEWYNNAVYTGWEAPKKGKIQMSNKRYSNKGVNAAAQAQAAAAAEQEGKRQSLIVCIVAAAVVIVAVILALVLGGVDKGSEGGGTTAATTTATTTTTTTNNEKANVDMAAVKAEINSKEAADFVETTETTEYVKLTVKHYGDVVIRLRSDVAPITVANFQKLVGEKFYDGLTFHRVMKGFMIQGGDPKGDGTGGSGTTIKGEFKINGVQNDLSHITGVISMARRSSPYDSATSQFFICNDDSAARNLDGSYAAFGYVVAGLDVVLTVSEVEVTAKVPGGEQSLPVEPVYIEKVCFVNPK